MNAEKIAKYINLAENGFTLNQGYCYNSDYPTYCKNIKETEKSIYRAEISYYKNYYKQGCYRYQIKRYKKESDSMLCYQTGYLNIMMHHETDNRFNIKKLCQLFTKFSEDVLKETVQNYND